MEPVLTLPEKPLIDLWHNEPTIFRLMNEKKWPREMARQWFTDFMRWLYTSNRWNIEQNNGFIMDNMHPLDDIWHAYILNTKDYFEMSKKLLNVEYIHHNPENPFNKETMDPDQYRAQLTYLLNDWGEDCQARSKMV